MEQKNTTRPYPVHQSILARFATAKLTVLKGEKYVEPTAVPVTSADRALGRRASSLRKLAKKLEQQLKRRGLTQNYQGAVVRDTTADYAARREFHERQGRRIAQLQQVKAQAQLDLLDMSHEAAATYLRTVQRKINAL